ncbi:putative phospholipid-transporting ATPase IIB [Smittium culicis]|uniref:Phospholipid-transporting ATPase n=1 Tax=Smittium culicis TaxID=133412 RepID=A0A1R1XNF5_9FUNG|nr:putative phospholipid-transporting ATPase IIB [Smittium culicis]
MQMMRIHLGNISYSIDTMDEVYNQLKSYYDLFISNNNNTKQRMPSVNKNDDFISVDFNGFSKNNQNFRTDQIKQTFNVVECLALCHNVTPTSDSSDSSDFSSQEHSSDLNMTYSASSPDEIAIVEWTNSVGLTLIDRSSDGSKIVLDFFGSTLEYHVLDIIPFTSESKRMGIIIRDLRTNQISFIQKGADSVMLRIITYTDWVEEEVSNMAREGLRTLIVGKKNLTEVEYLEYKKKLDLAKQQMHMRKSLINKVISDYLEFDLSVVCVTGVEDKLQPGVQNTLEQMRNAGFKTWMLTGDKVETAICIAISTKLVEKTSKFKVISIFTDHLELKYELDMLSNLTYSVCLVIDGQSLQLCLDHYPNEFIEIATKLQCVVCCRCSPTQKGEIVVLIQNVTKRRVVAIGDGGNDVGMIQVANVGIGLMGKEGQQASLASDFAITKFHHMSKLILWHGRNSYKRSCTLSQFVIHRGLIISFMQFVFSVLFYYAPIPLFNGVLIAGYSTVFTMFPVFLLVTDTDISARNAIIYPELYRDLTKGRYLNLKTFTIWLLISVYQGTIMVYLALKFFELEFINIVSILFTGLILNELLMVIIQLHIITKNMVLAQILSLSIYFASMYLLPNFDLDFILSMGFVARVAIITAISSVPLFILKIFNRIYLPPSYSKLD